MKWTFKDGTVVEVKQEEHSVRLCLVSLLLHSSTLSWFKRARLLISLALIPCCPITDDDDDDNNNNAAIH